MKELTIEAKKENLDQVLAFIDGVLEANGCAMKVQIQIDIAVEEMFVNIFNYLFFSVLAHFALTNYIIK